MKNPKLPTDFVKSLLAQDSALAAPEFSEQRRRLLERLAIAGNRERRSRRITIGAVAVVFAAFLFVYAAGTSRIANTAAWPEWAKTLTALTLILLPFTALLLATIYVFHHRRELSRSREDAYRAAIGDFPRQMAELRRELELLREQVSEKSPSVNLSRDRSAFSLLELLVVVGIVGVLAGLLFPALSGARARGRTTDCAGHLQQLAMALLIYETDAGCYPGAGQPVQMVGSGIKPSTNSWSFRLFGAASTNSPVLFCPGYRPQIFSGLVANSYGYNAPGSGNPSSIQWNLGLGWSLPGVPQKPIRGDDVLFPSDMAAIGDIQLHPSVWLNTISPNISQPINFLGSVIASRHNGGANVVFCDAHVEFARQTDWTLPTDQARGRWNNDHQPHAETW